ncbi:MAG: sugar ABC transporter substrate-binding protein [Actinobacteria bacterium]|nr:MAG: sugar ABC transporter substrate-binding protein [Actinomycetota bacterium]
MRGLPRRTVAIALAIALVGVIAAAASARGNSPAKKSATIQVCVLLPDTTSSVRYELFDRPYLAKAFRAAHITYSINNALGDQNKQRSQADQCLTNGAKVILVDALNSGVGASIETTADARHVKTVDYDRLVLNGKAAYYVSFNNVNVGKLQGKGVVAGLRAKGTYSKKPVVAELNGAPTDNNAKLFKQGYDSILKPLYNKGTFKKGPDQSVPDWNNQKARTIFDQMLVRTNNKINAVAAANDGLAGAVVSSLQAHHLKPVPLSGQDATPQGVQNILAGWQTMTVYKSVKLEAATAAKVAIAIIKNQPVKTNSSINNGTRKVPSIFLKPVTITKLNYKLLFKDGFLRRNQVCIGKYRKYCK